MYPSGRNSQHSGCVIAAFVAQRAPGAGGAATAADPPPATVAARNPTPAPPWPGTGTKIDLLV
jgi:hypothetical protein